MRLHEYIYGCVLFLGVAFVSMAFGQSTDGFQDAKIEGSFGVLCIFKNEAMVIREWVEHYFWQGADHIIMLDNGSTDNFKEQLVGFDHRVIVISVPEPHAQVKHYNESGLPEARKRNISMLAVLDVDEYLFSKDGTSLKNALKTQFSENPGVSQVSVNWTMFGSSGHDIHPKNIRRSFKKCGNDVADLEKSVVLVNKTKKINVHKHDVEGDTLNISDTFQLNHYAILSKEYFEKVKMTRGDVANGSINTIRDWKYFDDYDTSDRDCYLLRDHTYKHL